MGRRKKGLKLSEMNRRTLECKCGRLVEVEDDNVVEVTCPFCITKSLPLRLLNPEQLDEYDKLEQERIEAAKHKPAKLSKNGKRVGRPRKNSQQVINEPTTKALSTSKELKKIYQRGSKHQNSLNKNTSEVKSKKRNSMGRENRGRKATVGAKVLNYITNQNGNVEFPDILKIYSEERDKLGKKDIPKVEERNCRSTLYVLVKKGKLREITKKQTYAV